MQITHYQDRHFYYFRKPAGIPSTFGKQKCFIDVLLESTDKNIVAVMAWQQEMFDKSEEYGLVNRLDNDTSGLLYFAKTPLVKQKYKQAQAKGEIKKHYMAEVYGKFLLEEQVISRPIGHHKFSSDRMVVISDTVASSKTHHKNQKIEYGNKPIRGKLNYVDTYVKKLYYDDKLNTTVLSIVISKGIRHQIRSHLSSLGFPIVGEKIYIKQKKNTKLQLFSLGLERKF